MTGTAGVIASLVEAFAPVSANRFSLFGMNRVVPGEEAGDVGGDGTRDAARAAGLSAAALDILADALYTEVHCALPASDLARDRISAAFVSGREYLELLSQANTGTGSWQPGWHVRAVEGAAVVARRLDVDFQVREGQWRSNTGDARVGDVISVRVPREYRQLMPGFYVATGDADDDMDGAAAVRVYWHVGARGAVDLVRALTSALNSLRVTFHLKTNVDPRSFGRTDALILYLKREQFAVCAAQLAAVAEELSPHLDVRVSPFAKRLCDGVAVAEDPGGGRSFGEHRARLIAEALGSERSVRAASVADRLFSVREHLASEGLDPAALYLNPGSADIYPAFAT